MNQRKSIGLMVGMALAGLALGATRARAAPSSKSNVVSAEPAGIVIVKGRGCDTMSFFSAKEAGEKWQKEHDGEGTLFTLANAVKNGAEIFGAYSEGL